MKDLINCRASIGFDSVIAIFPEFYLQLPALLHQLGVAYTIYNIYMVPIFMQQMVQGFVSGGPQSVFLRDHAAEAKCKYRDVM